MAARHSGSPSPTPGHREVSVMDGGLEGIRGLG